jgi:mannose-6-phosphate isomerase-like protein (cupin superfamily)
MAYRIDADEGARQTIGGFAMIHKVDGEATGGLVAVAGHVVQPHQLGSPRHTHSREHEVSYVVEGTLGVELGGETFEAGPGTTVLKPKGVPHAFWNPGDVELRFFEVFAPAGFEHYFEELEPLMPGDGPPTDIQALLGVYERYGLEMDLGSLPELIQRHGLAIPG